MVLKINDKYVLSLHYPFFSVSRNISFWSKKEKPRPVKVFTDFVSFFSVIFMPMF